MLTEDELIWIRETLSDYKSDGIKESFYYRVQIETEREANKENVRMELDQLRMSETLYRPEELIKLRIKTERAKLGIENFAGIYIIYNHVRDMFYIGQAVNLFDRAYGHFRLNKGSKEIYDDYKYGDDFYISLIKLENTSFSTLNELEDNAIRAYNSLIPYGYNKNSGNLIDKALFSNAKFYTIADLIINDIKDTDLMASLTNMVTRREYLHNLYREYKLPYNLPFHVGMMDAIKDYHKTNKKSMKKKE
ncbi:GIY-YIG catalytic domain-containing protein [Planomicrobium soli]|uniref:GIY-YIG catalytic domain-containing protein n=1 Tax=Planomicrobium soli TaxID=1176648 RepID=A0A2P8H4L9_9BACL|nr:GIY-YIG nuclease family protein [Planomicrobium soli]PSL41154.1 GIY-YIG catalytic domain-containing protein [Planomicrobium soli]